MRYLEETGQLTPDWRMKLEAALNQGWQRLLTFEVSGGGFDWYGKAPANTLLTAYGLMELHDINKVFPIDAAVMARAKALLAARQKSDGRWSLDRGAHSWRQVAGDLPVTAYVTWAILEAGASEPRGVAWLESHYAEATDPYALALVANALLLAKSPVAARAVADLEKAIANADTETLALAALALIRGGRPADEAMARVIRAKDPQGGWHSTSATILAIKALLEGGRAVRSGKGQPIAVRVNGQPVRLDPLDEVLQQVNVTGFVREGDNEVEVECDARISVQAAARCWIPWALVKAEPDSPLQITTRYDKERLKRGETLRCEATIRYTGEGAFMVIADLGIPPGFTVDASAFKDRRIDKVSVGARHVTLYFGAVTKGDIVVTYDLRPKWPIVAKTPRAHAYEYYRPDREGSAPPASIAVEE